MSEARLFYTDEAQELGIPEAVFINYLRLFIRGNKQKGQNIDDDGRTWTYARYEDIAEEHPFWTIPQVGRLVRKLRDAGIIYAEKRGYAPETWFAFVDESRLRNRSDTATKSSRHGNESVESTIYTEVVLKNTEACDRVISAEMVREYFYDKGYSDSDATFLSDGFVSHDHKKYPLTEANWRRKASEWANRAVKFDGIKKPVGPFTDEQIRDPQTGNINTAVYRKRNTGWFK